MQPNEAMKAMARSVAANMPGVNALQRCAFLDGEWDDAPTVQAALAAIMETQRLDAELAARETGKYPHGNLMYGDAAAHKIATAIRTGEHYALAGER